MIRPRSISALVALVSLLFLSTPGLAKLEIKGKGKRQTLVRSQFSAEMQPRYDLFASKCTQCHAMKRPISALTSGITPVSGDSFNKKDIKHYVVKMMRKPNSGITRGDAKDILRFLVYAREIATK